MIQREDSGVEAGVEAGVGVGVGRTRRCCYG